MVNLVDKRGVVRLSVSALAESALCFAIGTGSFFARELPGDLTEEEKVALVAMLVSCCILRVA
jgi:hypothetical protein